MLQNQLDFCAVRNEIINPLSTKAYLSDLKNKFVPRSKHTPSQLYKPDS